jgi:porin
MKSQQLRIAVAMALLPAAMSAHAFDVNDQFSIGGIIAAAGQCQSVSALLPSESYGTPLDENGDPMERDFDGDPPGGYDTSMDAFDDECRGGMPLQLEASYHPNDYNEFFLKLGFGLDNGLNTVSPWSVATWGADLEDDVKDINGRGRDYLLAAWYKHTFVFQNESTLGATVGIVDSSNYLDGNEFANDKFNQFSNEVFENSGSYGLPSYDAGLVLEWEHGPWSANAIGMNIGENDDGNNYNFWGAQFAYQADIDLGTGNYRVIVAGTSSEFLDPTETTQEKRLAWGLSFDQELGDVVGAFLRLAWQDEDAKVVHRALYSGGLNFNGSGWGREPDNIGIGYSYLDGGNQGIEDTRVFEAYYRVGINEYLGVTADVQHLKDNLEQEDPRQEDPDGWVFGMRLTAEF